MKHRLFQAIFLLMGGISPVFSQKILQGFAQGTSYRILLYPENATIQKYRIDSVLNALDSSLSLYKPYSLISRFNAPETREIIMDEHLQKVVQASFRHWKISKGRFDITVGPLTEIYRSARSKGLSSPPEEQITAALKYVGMRKLRVRGKRLSKKQPGVKIDVDGIAQGYSVDVLAGFLEACNIRNYLVELGGEIKTRGTHPDGRKFRIAVEKPVTVHDSLTLEYETLEIFNTAVTTSGLIRKHHLHPATGRPFSTSVLSATVFAATAMDADAIDNYIIAFPEGRAPKRARKGKVILVSEKRKANSKK